MWCRHTLRARLGVLLLLVFAAGFLAVPGFAQYFGQNKVRYRTFDFRVLKTPHFDIHFYDEETEAVQLAAGMLENWYARLSQALNHELPPNQPIILYDSPTSFRGTTVIPGMIGESTGGVTEGLRRRVIMPFAGPLAETDHVLGHELVHAFQYHMASPGGVSANSGLTALPLWFVEGMAEYLSIGAFDPQTAMWVRDAIAHDRLPEIKDLNSFRYFPYRWGHAFWAYVAGRYGEDVVGRMLVAAGRSGRVDNAIRSVLDISQEELSSDWKNALTEQYGQVMERGQPASELADELISDDRHGGSLNVSPSVSPDGNYLAFLSERSLFSIELYLADARTGEIIRKLTDTAVDAHFDSLGFVNSAGAWSADSRQFVYPSVSAGRPQLNIYDVERNRTIQSIRFEDLGEIFHATWSPDGTRVAFSAMRGGLMDLYAVDLRTEQLQPLTNDSFAELHPSWSPDGRMIAFVTDRYGATPQALGHDIYQLALLDVGTREVTPLRTFDSGKQTNPQWSADGSQIFFISDPDGVSNIYAVSLRGGTPSRLTNLQTGITGISSLSPALAVATDTGRIIFSVMEDGDYNLYAMERPGAPADATPFDRIRAGGLPPLREAGDPRLTALRQPPQVEAGLAQPRVPPRDLQLTDYNPNLSLEYVAPLSLTVGTTSFGSLVGGGLALYWSDLLGQHNLLTGVQTSSVVDRNFARNIAGVVGYQNQKSRWDWGAIAQQVPYVSGSLVRGFTSVDGRPAVVEESTTFWQVERQVAGVFAYPFNRAQRVEFSAGYQNIGFFAETQTIAFSPSTGEIFIDEIEDLPSPQGLNMGIASSALVFDTSIFGGTSPVAGQRYRFEMGGNAGSLSFYTGLADYRRYHQVARPLSLAARLLHYGRYGGGSEDSRLQSLFLGYTSLVRGYESSSFSIAECGPQVETTGDCPVFDQLLGSRVALGNAEARLQILGPLGLIPSSYVPPLELAPFYDAGIAWTSASQADLLGRVRSPVSSTGLTGRVNLLGIAVLQVSYVRAFDRPARRWGWEWGLVAGF